MRRMNNRQGYLSSCSCDHCNLCFVNTSQPFLRANLRTGISSTVNFDTDPLDVTGIVAACRSCRLTPLRASICAPSCWRCAASGTAWSTPQTNSASPTSPCSRADADFWLPSGRPTPSWMNFKWGENRLGHLGKGVQITGLVFLKTLHCAGYPKCRVQFWWKKFFLWFHRYPY